MKSGKKYKMKCCQKTPDPSPSRFTNTWIGDNRVSIFYLIYRWSLAILFVIGIIQSIIQNTLHFIEAEEIENIYKYFIYLTNNGRLVACAACTLDAVLVTIRWRKERLTILVFGDECGRLEPRYKILWILWNINSSLSMVITLVFWIALYTPERHPLDFENFSGHLLTAVASLVDVFVSDRPWRMGQVLHVMLFGGVFGVFSFTYTMLGGTNYFFEPYIYHILDWSKPGRTILVILGVTVFLVILHTLFFVLYKIRTVLKKKYTKRREGPTADKQIQDEKSKALLTSYQQRGDECC